MIAKNWVGPDSEQVDAIRGKFGSARLNAGFSDGKYSVVLNGYPRESLSNLVSLAESQETLEAYRTFVAIYDGHSLNFTKKTAVGLRLHRTR
jgi:hypothetical protein